MIHPLESPIHKVGLVLLRDVGSDDPLVCLTQVKAKNPSEQDRVKFGLPKGTRRYRDTLTGTMKDARDFTTAVQYRAQLEPLADCLMNEAQEEAGLDKRTFAEHTPRELGPRLFASETNDTTFDIQWYAMQISDVAAARMNLTPPDAHAVQWVRLSAMQAMHEAGQINRSYYPVAFEAVQKMRERSLWPTDFLEVLPTR